jgi:uncharacterized protein YcfJ
MNSRRLSTLAAVSTLALVTACAGPARREERREARRQDNVAVAPVPAPVSNASAEYGSVSGIDVVSMASHNSSGGAVLGAVLGAVVGNQFGSGTGRALATGAGAVGGAVIGNRVQNRNRKDDEVYRVSVRFDSGNFRAYDFQRVDDLQVGDRVMFQDGQLHRM